MVDAIRIVQNDFPKLIAELAPRLDAAKLEAAEQIKIDAEQASPRGLAGKWSVEPDGKGFKVSNSDWRAVFAEDGTPYRAATPMLAPALERGSVTLEDALDKAFTQ